MELNEKIKIGNIVEKIDRISKMGLSKEEFLNSFSKAEKDILNNSISDVIEKGGEGSRGGKVIGHTKSGKPIYATMNAKHEKTFSANDHKDAAYAHLDEHTKTKSERHLSEYERHLGTSRHKRLNEDLDKEKSIDNDIEKGGKVATIGEIREWSGKKYKKQGNGKWLEVSESHGMTKKEHEESYNRNDKKALSSGQNNDSPNEDHVHYRNNANSHKEAATKLSEKEHEDHEVGLGSKTSEKKLASDLYQGRINDLAKQGIAGFYNVPKNKLDELKLDGTDSTVDLARALNLPIDETNFNGVKENIKKFKDTAKVAIDMKDDWDNDLDKVKKEDNKSKSDKSKEIVKIGDSVTIKLPMIGKKTVTIKSISPYEVKYESDGKIRTMFPHEFEKYSGKKLPKEEGGKTLHVTEDYNG